MIAGREPITQRDVAASLGVSISAVSLALSGRAGVSDRLRAQILARAAELGYRPNVSAVALRTKRTKVLGLLIRNLRNPHFLDVIDGFDETCARAGYDVMVGSSRYDPDRERELLDAFQDRAVDGLAVAPIGASPQVREWHSATKRPVVLLNAAERGERAPMSVRADHRAAVDFAVRHLIGLGHRRLAMLVAPPDKAPDPERWQRFRELSAELGFRADAVITELSAAAARSAAVAELRRPPGERPTAFIANSDYLAHAVYLAAADLDLTVPHDISVIGHDDLPTSASLAPPLTTVAVNRREIGERAATLLIDALDGRTPETTEVIVPVRLRVRSSTAPPAV
ncbi:MULTISPECIES: LacI family DNA-binding transcriptional regulator [unclassified Nocardia]|uniref:LacI family DNA-binding transcriptional regulator n=1 Tax=unclassified Nocardia TaxID=2637762 RepID=UPI001CE4880A|nr:MULTISPECIES: LacI family DNA-binding transcriptional regulator [unclassified Nocardia]